MLDVNRDFRADRVRLTFSERIRHVLDRDGRYPFRVAGYRIRSVGAAKGRTITLVLVERRAPDPKARPSIRYRRASSRPVRDRAGNQAVRQVFRKTRPHGHAPSASSPTPTPTTPTPTDADGDGTPDSADCAPRDPAIHPGAADLPDLGFVDANCDGIDGTEGDAVFVSPTGSDTNRGTKAKPKRDVQAAVDVVEAGKAKYVLVAFGSYGHVRVGSSGVGIYGGYDPSSWKRVDRYPGGLPLILGSPEGVFVSGARGVVLQHLEIRSLNGTLNVAGTGYGVRAKNGATVTLQRVVVAGGAGAVGAPGSDGRTGAKGSSGGPGLSGKCDEGVTAAGGKGGVSPVGRPGGDGGYGGGTKVGGGVASPGKDGKVGTRGGIAGKNGNPGTAGGDGQSGENGSSGSGGGGGTRSDANANAFWRGQKGGAGAVGEPGEGGGGGGGGGGQTGAFVIDGTGNGGRGGVGGRGGGGGGGAGGPSVGIMRLGTSTATLGAGVTVTFGGAGAGGAGGSSGPGGGGAAGAAGVGQKLYP